MLNKMMKIALALSVSLAAGHAFACSPPIPSYYQASSVGQVLDSESFRAELQKQTRGNFSVRIEQINFQNGKVNVVLSNGCNISSKLNYEAPSHPGLCPRMIGIESSTACRLQ